MPKLQCNDTPKVRLFDKNNMWTKEALLIHSTFARLTEEFIKQHDEYDARDLEYTLNSAVKRASQDIILLKRMNVKR